ncbi:hypothetical protein D5045_04175 [Verminephrobacter eiseniae]|nr:hypothetical protein [Verminephrobacter eiseniae]
MAGRFAFAFVSMASHPCLTMAPTSMTKARGTVSGPWLYQLIRQASPITDRRFEIEFLDLARRSSRSPAAEHGSAAWGRCQRGVEWGFDGRLQAPWPVV